MLNIKICMSMVLSVTGAVARGDELYKNDGKLSKQCAKNGINRLPDRIYIILTRQPKAKV